MSVNKSSLSELDLSSFKHVYVTMSDQSVIKLVLSVLLVSFRWVFADKVDLVLVVFFLVVIDTFTGFWRAIKRKDVSSRGFFRFAAKLVVYFLLIVTGALVDKVSPTGFALALMAAFLAMTEAISIMENVAQLGFPVPEKLINVLRNLNEDKAREEKQQKEK